MADHFATLGLPRKYTLDLDEVERSYLAKSRALHPDFHQTASDSERTASEAAMARLNEAYIALQEPYRRIEHLLALTGGPTAAEQKNMDQAFLMEMMETRERIDEARAAGGDLAPFRDELEMRLRDLLSAAGKPFDTMPAPDQTVLIAVRGRLNGAKTVMSLLRDFDQE